MLELTTDFGIISVSKTVISRIISEAVSEFEGEVHLTNRKGKPLKLRNESGFVENAPSMEIKADEDGISLKFFVLMKIGMSISAVTNRMFDYISEEILVATGMNPTEMTIVVTGMYTKDIKNVGKRNIEVKR